MNNTKLKSLVLAAFIAGALVASASPAKISVAVDKPAHKIPKTLWGIFFEDINLSADGGIYPELVENRSFEDADTPENWKFTSTDDKSTATIATADNSTGSPVVPLNPLNPRSLCIKANGAFTLENDGYWGMNIVKGEGYTLKLAARENGFRSSLAVKLLSTSGQELASGDVKEISGGWKYYTVNLIAAGSDPKARLKIFGSGEGTLFLDMISLLPKKTWKNHGLRPDLAESIAALQPAFMRFPGGCWVEGEDRAHMYNWKKTIGDVDQRVPLWNIWKYYATHGLGYHEYLELCEDLGAEPLWDINCGMSHRQNVPMDEMDQWVQDALDSVEYANGPTNSKWGALRAKHGHPAPFNLRYMEIGNENGGAAYRERWPLFVKAIKAKYPEMQLIANHWQGGYPKDPAPDIVDEHFYNTPEWFMSHANHFDKYDRNGPKIFVGEYAVTRNTGKGNLRGAIGEAAFMTGLERNSDVVILASYAPLFVNLNHRAWNPDLINFDSSRWYGLPSYYVQKLFAEHRGDVVLPTEVKTAEVQEPAPAGRFGVGTWNTAAEFKDIKVTAPDGKVLFTSDFNKNTDGWTLLGDRANWSAQDGALRQTAEREFIRAVAGDKSWTDYTLELKARKISGREGFLILFHILDSEDRNWWNIAGWNNSQHAIELDGTMDPKRGSVETGRWYDIKVTLTGHRIQCWLDGKLMHDIQGSPARVRGLYASSARDERTGDVIVKVVNAAREASDVEIALDGAKNLSGDVQATVLTSANATDENSIDEPEKVSPRPATLKVSGGVIQHAFPANSLTVLRVKSK